MSRILVTGCPGWFGNAFVESLGSGAGSELGVSSIRLLVDSKLGDIAAIPGSKLPIEIHRGSLTDPESLRGVARDCDYVVHAAGVIHVKRPGEWSLVNAQGTRNLLAEIARAATVKRLVYISSNAAVGKSPALERLLTEEDIPKPLSEYGRSKLLAEEAVRSIVRGTETVILRPCMFYGPPTPERHIEIYRRILNGRMPIIELGKYSRSVTHIQSLVSATALALTRPQAVGQTFFIADREAYTLERVIEAMAGALGVKPRYLRLPSLASTAAHWMDGWVTRSGFYSQNLHLLGEANWNVGVSIEKARTLLGYEPKMDLERGMAETIEWCRRCKLI